MTRPEDHSLLVVSHPSVVPINQSVYVELLRRGWDVKVVVPSQWRHEYRASSFRPTALPELEGRLLPLQVGLPGRPQRHFYIARLSRIVAAQRPQVAFLEQEPFSIPAFQWGRALAAAGIPFGVQADENLDRSLPLPARLIRSYILRRAAFVAARSPAAQRLVIEWGAQGRVDVVPHAVPEWAPAAAERSDARFTVGYAGRLIEEKGLRDLVAAAELMQPKPRLLLVGDGALRPWLEQVDVSDLEIEIRTSVSHEDMPRAYADMDVLVLPSRSTPTWEEQFGRVLAEALWCGVPVVGSQTGEIPWVIESTGGGRTYPEGDIAVLARTLEELRQDPGAREELASAGREAVERLFAVRASATALEALLSGEPARDARASG